MGHPSETKTPTGAALARRARTPPDDFAADTLSDRANLDEQDTNVPGTVLISTALGSHGPRVKWYPDRPGRSLPCLIVSIGPEPQVRDDFLPSHVSRPAFPLVAAWVKLNHAELLDFWAHGETWHRRRVSSFLDGLRPLPK